MSIAIHFREGGTNLDPYVVRDLILLYEAANKIKICIASSGIRNLNLLVTTLDEQFKESRFLLDRHGVGKGLISITQVCGEPYWRHSRPSGRPLTIWEMEGGVRFVPLRRVNARHRKSAHASITRRKHENLTACMA